MILYLILICIILRGVLFHKREVKWYKTLIPYYNKKIIGDLCDSKKLGILTAIASMIMYITFFISYGIELNIINSLSVISEVELENFNVLDYVSQDIMTANDISKIILLVFAIIYFLLWTILMRKFSYKNNSSTWFMLLWSICPVVAYIYFDFIKKEVYIPNEGLVTYIVEKEKIINTKSEQ